MNSFKLLMSAICSLLLISCIVGKELPEEKELDKKIEALILQMTLEEKIIQMNSAFPNGNARLKIPQLSIGEALHGIWAWDATCFPQAIGLGATWDPGVIEKMGVVIGKEGRALGIHHVYSPMLGLARDARWGRVEESYGEDPFHVSRIGVAFIKGVQGMGDERFGSDKMICTPKHFAGDGESLRGSNAEQVEVCETTFRETSLVPFEAAIKEARAGSLMPAHHALNRIPCHANKWLLQTVLRDEWGFDGFLVSDNIDIIKLYRLDETEGHYLASSKKDAARLALEAGVDSELAMWAKWDSKNRTYGSSLVESVNEGLVPIEIIDRSVRRILKAKFRLGLFDDPKLSQFDLLKGVNNHPDENTTDYDPWAIAIKNGTVISTHKIKRDNWKEVLEDPSHEKLALEIAQKSIVLLKNENNLLPLSKSKLNKIAVIGPNAADTIKGGYSGTPRYFVSVLEGIKKYVSNDIKVEYARGCDLMHSDNDNIPQAVSLAKKSDLSIVVVGTSRETMGENHDRSIIELTGKQEELVMAIHATGKPVVVVLINGGPIAIPEIKENIPAIVEGWYAGQETGTAIAQVLFGEINPGGKLPVTFPNSTGMVPCYYNAMPAGGPQLYNEGKFKVCYPFGYGLSYTTFEISEPTIDKNQISKDGKAVVSVNVKNTGNREGDEVVQLYLIRKNASMVRPPKELKAFKRIRLEAGETKNLTFEVGFEQLKSWLNSKWDVEKGAFEIMVGSSSENGKNIKLHVI